MTEFRKGALCQSVLLKQALPMFQHAGQGCWPLRLFLSA